MLRTLSVWLAERRPFVGEEVPINPQVARFFELAWWSPDLVYHLRAQPFTFDEWIADYMSEPLPSQIA